MEVIETEMISKSNRANGNAFEKLFSELLFENGFWVHNMAQNASGQPADIIAVREGKPLIIDCKRCDKGFALSRIEENQEMAMSLWKSRGNGEGWFSILNSDGDILMFSLSLLKSLKRTKRVLTASDLKVYGIPFERWVNNI